MHAICKCRCNMRTKKCTLCSDQTNAIPHWLWNQPSAPPVHPEDGVKGCLGNAGESVGAAQDVIMPLPYQLDKAKPSENKINNARSYNLELMVHCFYMFNKTSCNCKMIRAICKYRCNMCTRWCTLFSDQTNAIPHWLWNQPSAPPVHPEDGVKGCLGNAVKVSEPQKMSSCHSHINLTRQNPFKAKPRMLGHITLGWHG